MQYGVRHGNTVILCESQREAVQAAIKLAIEFNRPVCTMRRESNGVAWQTNSEHSPARKKQTPKLHTDN